MTSLHRFVDRMAGFLLQAVQKIALQYESDASSLGRTDRPVLLCEGNSRAFGFPPLMHRLIGLISLFSEFCGLRPLLSV